MCGIIGFAGFKNESLAVSMLDSIAHRGPDNNGIFISNDCTLGNQRLSIVDIHGGNQPFYSEDKKIVLVFNGEIYNFLEIKKLLEQKGHNFRFNAEGEVLLKAYIEWGEEFFKKLDGMFAIALWDDLKKNLILGRDPFGVKPLYYKFTNNTLTFGSEIKAILKESNFTLNEKVICTYFRFRFILGLNTIYNQVEKVPPGSYLKFSPKKGEFFVGKYFFLSVNRPIKNIKINDCVDGVDRLLNLAVKKRLMADVPISCFLSGGLDSSLLVAITSRYISKFDTFSLGFNSSLDETKNAKLVSNIFSTNHHEYLLQSHDFDQLDKIAWHLDQPFGDSIVLPMYVLSKEVSKFSKVVLSGEGADEIFGGYLFYRVQFALTRISKIIPIKALKMLASSAPLGVLEILFKHPEKLSTQGKNRFVDILSNFNDLSNEKQFWKFITLFNDCELRDLFKDPESLSGDQYSFFYNNFDTSQINGLTNLQEILNHGLQYWLPDNIMMKLDKMSMAHSVEAREPYLDVNLVKFGMQLPDQLKVDFFQDKKILRLVAKRYLPKEIVFQSKKPFTVPSTQFKNLNSIRLSIQDLLESSFMKENFNIKFIKKIFEESNNNFIKGKQLMSLIMFHKWYKSYFEYQK